MHQHPSCLFSADTRLWTRADLEAKSAVMERTCGPGLKIWSIAEPDWTHLVRNLVLIPSDNRGVLIKSVYRIDQTTYLAFKSH